VTSPATPQWIDMPTPEGGSVRRPMDFKSLEDKARWLDAAARLDAHHPEIRELAIRYQKAYGANNPRAVATAIHAFCRDAIAYCYGPSGQEFADSWTILNRPGGACDNCAGKSRVFVALCTAIEIQARILPNFKSPDEFNHVQAQVRWPGSDKEPLAEAGGWLRAELIVRGVPLGQGPQAGQRDASGKLQLS
jgi:transglutaminase-like putative cysteine protease